MIRIQNLTKCFRQLEVLKGISVNIREGAVTGIVGPNAGGKTTLIKCILGLVVPDKGSIRVHDEEIIGKWEYRSRIGYMAQHPEFPGNLTLSELLRMLRDLRRASSDRSRELLERLALEPYLKRPLDKLSGGTKQKIAAMAAFLFDPPLLILDEPTVGLDPVSAVRFKKLVFEDAARGKTVILVSHMMGEVEQMVSEMVFLLDGRALFQGGIDEIRSRTGEPSLEQAIVHLIEKTGPQA
jgi:Cu-processing system ATP-binding protein